MRSVIEDGVTFDFPNKRVMRHTVTFFDVNRNGQFHGVLIKEQLITPQGKLRRLYTFAGEGPTIIIHKRLRTLLKALV